MMCFLLLCYAAFLTIKVGASCTPTATYTGVTIKGNDGLPRIAGLTIQGCGVSAPSGTFNTGFNQAGGGVFAMEWVQSKFIHVWNFVNPNIPADISSGHPNPSTWGLPNAYFALGSNCPASHFNNNTLTIIRICVDGLDNT